MTNCQSFFPLAFQTNNIYGAWRSELCFCPAPIRDSEARGWFFVVRISVLGSDLFLYKYVKYCMLNRLRYRHHLIGSDRLTIAAHTGRRVPLVFKINPCSHELQQKTFSVTQNGICKTSWIITKIII